MPRHHFAARVAVLAGSVIGSAVAGQVLHDNGGLITTPTPTCIPVGAASSQLQTVGGVPNGLIGIGCQLVGSTNNRAADDFVVSNAEGWNIASIDFFFYQTLWATSTSPITGINVRIWNGKPGSVGAQVVWGDTTTNRLLSGTFVNIYRVPAACSVSRRVFRCQAQVNTSLAPGTYWVDWQATGDSTLTGPWTPLVTITGQRGKAGANGIQFQSSFGTWDPVVDAGPAPETSPPVAQDFPFIISGTITGDCYANCDESTGNPVLTANDFQCFLNNYAANDPTANCDQSTGLPALTANDFQCFLNKFASGCS